MKIMQLFCLLVFFILLSCTNTPEKIYPEADAVYLNLTRTFILNKDGSIVNSVEKKQKLLTYRSFQSLYGETRIVYNPEFQKLVIQEAFTVNSQGEQIKTPENGFNDILPAFCLDSKAYSHLREMVVSHTGIERNAVTNCAYQITTEAGKIPILMGVEELQTDCPIEKLTIRIKVPSGKSLHYNLLNCKGEPSIEKSAEFDTYSWIFNDVPQRVKEIRSASLCEDVPTLLFSTQENRMEATNLIAKNSALNYSVNDTVKKYIDSAIKGKKSTAEKALRIQEVVVNELKTIHIPASLIAFQSRTPEEVWRSNSGTSLEKAILLTSILKSEGIKAELSFNVPDCCVDPTIPFLLLAEPVISVIDDNGVDMLLSSEKLNGGKFDLTGGNSILISLNANQKNILKNKATGKIHVEGQLSIDSKGGIKGELNGVFSDVFNPWYELIRNPGTSLKLLADFPGFAGKVNADRSEIQFKVDQNELLVKRGDFSFIDLTESKMGISSFHLNPLPFARTTQLNLGYAISESYHYSFKLPTGYHLLNPVKIELSKPGIGAITISLSQTGNVVETVRRIDILKNTISKDEYSDFKLLMDKWSTHKFRQLILKKG